MTAVEEKRPQIRVYERFANPFEAFEARCVCSLCEKPTIVRFPFGVTPPARRELVSKALEEHRWLCTVGSYEMRRTYKITYPRR